MLILNRRCWSNLITFSGAHTGYPPPCKQPIDQIWSILRLAMNLRSQMMITWCLMKKKALINNSRPRYVATPVCWMRRSNPRSVYTQVNLLHPLLRDLKNHQIIAFVSTACRIDTIRETIVLRTRFFCHSTLIHNGLRVFEKGSMTFVGLL